jgi:hypothetical protein
MINLESHSAVVTIKINTQTGEILTVDENSNPGQDITRPELDEIAKHPQKGLRWRLSLFQFPGSTCWVVQTPGGERVFCA